MTEEMQALTEQGLAKALAYIETTESFVVEQAPLLIQELLNYSLVYSSFWAVFWFIMGLGGIFFGVKVYRWIDKDGGDPFAGVMLGFFVGGGCLGGAFTCLATVVKILIAPRLFLIQRLGDLV